MERITGKSRGNHGALPSGGRSRAVFLALQEAIAAGRYPVGSVLPGETKLAAVHGVSRVTVRSALAALADAGVVSRQVGRGSVVLPQEAAAPTLTGDVATLMPQLQDMAERTDVRLLSFAYGAPPPDVARALALAPDVRVQTAVRVRLADGVPFSHLTTHVPEDIAASYSEADLATTPLFRLLERGGRRIGAAEQSVGATLAGPAVAEALGVPPGSALLALERVVRDADGGAVEFLSALYRPDLFRLSMRLHRVGGGKARYWEPVIAREPGAREAAE